MKTLRQLAEEPPMLPTHTAWYLADLGEARGKQPNRYYPFNRVVNQVLTRNQLIEKTLRHELFS